MCGYNDALLKLMNMQKANIMNFYKYLSNCGNYILFIGILIFLLYPHKCFVPTH